MVVVVAFGVSLDVHAVHELGATVVVVVFEDSFEVSLLDGHADHSEDVSVVVVGLTLVVFSVVDALGVSEVVQAVHELSAELVVSTPFVVVVDFGASDVVVHAVQLELGATVVVVVFTASGVVLDDGHAFHSLESAAAEVARTAKAAAVYEYFMLTIGRICKKQLDTSKVDWERG